MAPVLIHAIIERALIKLPFSRCVLSEKLKNTPLIAFTITQTETILWQVMMPHQMICKQHSAELPSK